MRVLIAGSSGFLGTHLGAGLTARGHDVRRLVRSATSEPGTSVWDPIAGTVDAAEVEAADVVVNLAGSPTAGNPHSKAWARELLRSRVRSTEVLAEAIASSARKPAFLAGNGISYYGDHGSDVVLTEASDTRGHALLTRVTREWEAAALPASAAGARVCVLRTAPVMDRRNAPLRQLRLLFGAGLGGRLGNGRQYMPMITLRDWVGGVVHLAENDVAGPVNLCLPTAPTNAEFTRALARALRRPAFLPAPAPVLSVLAGAMGPELLGSFNVRPQALLDAGYAFLDPTVDDLVRTGLNPA